MLMSRQLDYYYRKGRAERQHKAQKRKARKAKSKAKRDALHTPMRVGIIKPIPHKLIRLHAYGILFKLAESLSYEFIESKLRAMQIPYRKKDRGYFFTLRGFQACLSSLSLTVWAKEKDVPNDQQSLEKAYQELDREIETRKLDAKSLLELPPLDAGTVIENHVAFLNDEGAVQAVENDTKIHIKDPQDGKERFTVDQSTGEPEAEFMHRKHAKGDSMLYAQLVDEVTRLNRWNEVQDDIVMITEDLARLTDLMTKLLKEKGLL